MINTTIIESLAEKIASSLPAGGRALADDVKTNLRTGLISALERMDLVTREDFQIQTELLARTRARLEQLEKRLEEIESGKSKEQI
ncbi:MAG: accessory factor UbiK family protein [Gammaproteobacteria bacterium]